MEKVGPGLYAEYLFLEFRVDNVNFHGLPFHRPPHNHDSLFGARNRPFYQHQIRFRPDIYDLKVLH